MRLLVRNGYGGSFMLFLAVSGRYSKIETERPPLTADFRKELYKHFHEDICLLQQLTGRDLAHLDPEKNS